MLGGCERCGGDAVSLRWDAFIRELRTAGDDVVERGMDLLREEADWRALVRDTVDGLAEDVFVQAAAAVRVADVQPHPFVLHSEPRFSVVVNHYDRQTFDRLFDDGRITPHLHHFSFTSRVLRGGFCQITFTNSSTPDEPVLAPAEQTRFGEGAVFRLDHPVFHCVIAPEPDTVTLMVRGRPLFANPHIAGVYELDEARRDREALQRALA